MSSQYMFGVSTKKITKREAARRDSIAQKHGGNFVGPLTTAGNVGRSWFVIENTGAPHTTRRAREVLDAVGSK